MKSKRLLFAVLTAIFLLCISGAAFAATVSVVVSPASVAAESEVMFTLTIKNDGEGAMENIQISSAYAPVTFASDDIVIQEGGEYAFTKTALLSESMIGQKIEFDVQWTQGGENKKATASVTVKRASTMNTISVRRTVSSRQAAPGEYITIKYTVKNLGMSPITSVSITDKEIGGNSAIVSGISIEAGASYEYEYKYKMGYSTVISQPVVSYTVGSQKKTFTDIEMMTLGMVNAKIDIEVKQGTPTETGVPFTIYLTNNGNQKIKDIKIVDELGNRVSDDSFSLAVGETKSISCTISNQTERYVVFHITGTDASGEQYSDKTASQVVRRYIDPSTLGMDFSVKVLEPLNSSGSIRVQFILNNTGTVNYTSVTLSETEAGELYRADNVAPGSHPIDQTVYIGSPRNLVFTLNVVDPVGNPYTYTANVTADYISIGGSDGTAPGGNSDNVGNKIDDMGVAVGSAISNTLITILVVLGVLTMLAVIALISLSYLEKKQKARAAQRRRGQQNTQYNNDDTIISHRRGKNDH